MSIEDVIARSRQPGAFVERKRFAVERANAIRKMRQFALADPHYYVLELIQSAVANGASSINLMAKDSGCLFSYVGGGYSEGELHKLFDFLFAAKSDMAYSALRQLALGVNAIMLMNPREIIIESGDGTLEGTTRVVIMPGQDLVDVGTPDHALDGTFVRANGLKRSYIRGKSNLRPTDYGPPETRAIESRCLTLPIPIIVNDRSIFGFSSVRSPTLFGFSKVIAIDEGDLYGSLGFTEEGQGFQQGFKLLTYGTWVQTVDHNLLDGRMFGGIISYDRLNKTADHAAIVQDLRYEELWARLQPYARQLLYGKSEAARYEVRTLHGQPLSTKRLNATLAEHDYAVVIPADTPQGSPRTARAVRIAAALGEGTPILRVQTDDVHRVKYISRRAHVLVPELDTDRDERFLGRPQIEPPPTPWLIEPIQAPPITAAELLLAMWEAISPGEKLTKKAARALAENLDARWLTLKKGDDGEPDLHSLYNAVEGIEEGKRHMLNPHAAILGVIKPTLYAPVHAFAPDHEALVRFVSSGRLLWAGKVPSPFPGFVLVLEFDGLMPRHLDPSRIRKIVSRAPSDVEGFARLIARAALTSVRDAMQESTGRLFDNVLMEDVQPGNTAAQVCLGVLAREGHLRLDSAEHLPRFEMALMRPTQLDVRHVPLFLNLEGESLSMRQILDLMPSQGGLVYGVVDPEHAALDGLDRSRILHLTLSHESLLIAMLGAPAYVRIDGRDTLAMITSPALVQVRDMVLDRAVADESMRQLERRHLLISQHVDHLGDPQIKRLTGALVELVQTPPSEDLNEEDLRRQALRHLQRFVVRAHFDGEHAFGLDVLNLFVDVYGEPLSMKEIVALIEASPEKHLLMGDGRALDVLALHGSLTLRDDDDELPSKKDPLQARGGLAMNPYLAMLLTPYVRLRASFDVALEFEIDGDDVSSRRFSSEHFLSSREVSDEALGVEGWLGIPLEPSTTTQALIWRQPDTGRCFSIPSVTQDLGIVGVLEASDLDAGACDGLLYNASILMLESLLDTMPKRSASPQRWQRAIQVLLAWAGSFITLNHTQQSGLQFALFHNLAQRILELPIFDTIDRQPVSALAMARSFCNRINGYEDSLDLFARLDPDLSPTLKQWLDSTFHVDNIQRHRAEGVTLDASKMSPQGSPSAPSSWHITLEHTLTTHLQSLRPDEEQDVPIIAVRRPDAAGLTPHMFSRLRYFGAQFDAQQKKQKESFSPFLFVDEPGNRYLFIDDAHWLFSSIFERRHLEDASLSDSLAWALLAAYAHLNALLEPVTNAHEREFQLRVVHAVKNEQLTLLSS